MTQEVLLRAGGRMTSLKPHGCGTPSSPGRLIVAGDSHAGAYERMLWRYAYDTGRSVASYWLAGCPMIGLRDEPASEICAAFELRLADELALTLRSTDVVFLPSLRLPRFVDQAGERNSPTGREEVAKHADFARAELFLSRIAPTGARVVFEAPKPIFRTSPIRCADWFNRMNPVCRPGFAIARTELEHLRAPVLARMAELSHDHLLVSVWDPFPILCPEATCNAFDDGHALLFDGDHLTGYANDVLLPSFTAAMRAVFAEPAGTTAAAER